MPIHVFIHVSADVARALRHGAAATTDSRTLLETAANLGVQLEPMHGGAEEGPLAKCFVAEAPDSKTVARLIAQLRESNTIEAVYLKPPDESPQAKEW